MLLPMSENRFVRELALMARGLLALFVPSASIEELVQEDHRLSLSTNENLRKADAQVQAESLERTRNAVTDRLRLLRRALLLSVAILGSAVAGAIIFSRTIPAAVVLHRRFFAIASLTFFALGTMARLGWAGQSWLGRSVVERLDFKIFRTFYWLGTFAGTLALL
jgi:hypothetical protein